MRRTALLAALALQGACATAGSTFRSGVGDRHLEHPPYYAGRVVTQASVQRVARLPVVFQRGASRPDAFDVPSGPGTPAAALLVEMNAFLDSLFSRSALPAIDAKGSVAPNVYFGCDRAGGDDCVERGDSVLGRQGTTMRLAVERPSAPWIARHAALLDSVGASHALVITLEVGQYWTRQGGLLGKKTVELGTGYIEPLPWVTSLEAPVPVLQLTGALVARDGRAVRIGAEGLVLRRSPIVASGFGLQRLLDDSDVERARTLRHTGRPDAPLVWRAALCQLVWELSATRCRAG